MAFGQICRFCHPVVHLNIKVRVIVGIPRRSIAIGPESLKIGRQTTWTGTGNQKVTTILKEQFFKLGIIFLCRPDLALIGWHGMQIIGRRSEIKFYPVKQSMKILLMRCFQ